MASASKKKPGKKWNDSFQNCERHVHCIIESHMNYNMHILYTLNMLKYILSRYKISLLGYSRLLIKKKEVKISHNFIIKKKIWIP